MPALRKPPAALGRRGRSFRGAALFAALAVLAAALLPVGPVAPGRALVVLGGHVPGPVVGVACALVAAAVVAVARRGNDQKDKKTILIFGVGYSGERLAGKLLASGGWSVLGTSRSEDSRKRLGAALPGIRLFPNASAALAAAAAEGRPVTHVVATAAPGESGDPLLVELGDRAAEALSGVQWAGYMSTVGVYGDCSGAQVDESRAVAPKSKRGTFRVNAEQSWAQLMGDKLWIFRLPGIYGPGRGPLQKARSGEARRIVAPNGHVFSRVHVEDIVGSCVAALGAGVRPKWASSGAPVILNVVDNEPAAGHEVSGFAFELLGKEPPPCTDLDKADLPPIARSFYEESRHVLNTRMRRDLGYEPVYPTYREGLRAQLVEEQRLERRQALRALPSSLLAGLQRAVVAPFSRAAKAPIVVLVDNGSLRAESTLGLRAVAAGVAERVGSAASEVIAASARFSDRIDPGELGGKKARTILELLRQLREKRTQEVVILPIFFGPSGLVADFIPKQVAIVRSEPGPPMPVMKIAPTLICNCPFLFPGAEDDRVARILLDRIRETSTAKGLSPDAAVLIVDHGSPSPAVARCRELVVRQMGKLLGEDAASPALKPRAVGGCCMERREGPEYDFAGTLLEQMLADEGSPFARGEVILALMFLQPGRHAGENGDVATIVKDATAGREDIKVVMTDVVGAHPLLIELLGERLGQALRPAGW